MRRTARTSFTALLTRALLTSVTVATVTMVGALGTINASESSSTDSARHPRADATTTESEGQSVWKEEYSRRYPGCVSMALWPSEESPVAFVTRGPEGQVSRVEVSRSFRLPPAWQAIGACR